MIIFNNGKYKSILAAQPGELKQVRAEVEKDHDFRPAYHLAPPTGLLNDPNGLIFDGEKYHIFYQWFPFDAIHGMKHWKHFTTKDFQNYQETDALIPCELFESHGCYSGGALLAEDNIAAFYTGNTRRTSDNQRVPFQNLAMFDKNGKLLTKRPLIERAPTGYTAHFRDPKPFVTAEGKIRFVCGAQRENLSGTAIMFEMDDFDAQPRLLGELQLPAFDNSNVFMWECPDLFRQADKDIFIWSPQGKQRQAHSYQNNYHALYAVGKLNELEFNADHIAELDQGFDFYAPQTFAGTADRTVLFGWCGLPDLTYPTDQYQWHSMLTIPRELRLQGSRLYQQPIAEIYQNLTALESITLNDKAEIKTLDRAYVKFNAENQSFTLDFFENAKGQTLTLSYNAQDKLLCLDRSHSEQTESMAGFGNKRYCEIDNLQQVEIFFDHSIVEIFLNNGEKAMTSRFFIADRKNSLKTDRTLRLEVAYPQALNIRYLEEYLA